MNIREEIDNISDDLLAKPLSYVLTKLLPISLELADYEGFVILYYWNNTIKLDEAANRAMNEEIIVMLHREGLKKEAIATLVNCALKKYVKIRTFEKDKTILAGAREMEDSLKSYDKMFESLQVPDGLAPVDLYFRSEEIAISKMNVVQNKQMIERQCATLLTYVSSKITEYRRKIMLEERKIHMQKNVNTKNIFIIHGHNEAKRRELETLLRNQFNLNPIVLLDQPDQGLTIIEKFEKYATTCSYAFALFTPDDIVTNGDVQYLQARPNVIFELGWFYANLGRSRVCILDQASEQSKIFSDLQGILRMQFNNSISERYMEIERELKSVNII